MIYEIHIVFFAYVYIEKLCGHVHSLNGFNSQFYRTRSLNLMHQLGRVVTQTQVSLKSLDEDSSKLAFIARF